MTKLQFCIEYFTQAEAVADIATHYDHPGCVIDSEYGAGYYAQIYGQEGHEKKKLILDWVGPYRSPRELFEELKDCETVKEYLGEHTP